MIEKPPSSPAVTSAEKDYEMDTVEVRAIQFAHDPVSYLSEFYTYKLDSSFDEQDAVFKIVDEFEAVVAMMQGKELQTENVYLQQYIESDDAFLEKRAFVHLLKEAGVAEDQFIVWADMEDVDGTAEERLQERSYRRIIRDAYEIG